MRRAILTVCTICTVTLSALAGCTGNRPAELYETAEFEMLQNNREHAAELYSEIIKKYPESEYAEKARAKLADMKKE